MVATKEKQEAGLNTPLVSIIIPNYNYANFLEDRFCSILSQTNSNYEIIFLDDASSDGSLKLIEEKYLTTITKLDVSSVNSGSPFVQWNKGVRLSRGKYIWIAEADDICAPTFLEKAISVLEANPSVGLVYCQTLPIDINNQILDKHSFISYVSDLDSSRWLKDYHNSGVDEVCNYLSRKNTIVNVSGVIFRRDAYLAAGFAPENMRMCGDWLFYCQVLCHTDIVYLCEPLNFHRQHPVKQTANSVLSLVYFKEFLQVQKYIIEHFALSPALRRDMFARFLREWDRLVFSGYGRINLLGNFSIMQMTFTEYSQLDERALTLFHFLVNALKAILTKWIRN